MRRLRSAVIDRDGASYTPAFERLSEMDRRTTAAFSVNSR